MMKALFTRKAIALNLYASSNTVLDTYSKS